MRWMTWRATSACPYCLGCTEWAAGAVLLLYGKGLHSSTFQLNLSRF